MTRVHIQVCHNAAEELRVTRFLEGGVFDLLSDWGGVRLVLGGDEANGGEEAGGGGDGECASSCARGGRAEGAEVEVAEEVASALRTGSGARNEPEPEPEPESERFLGTKSCAFCAKKA